MKTCFLVARWLRGVVHVDDDIFQKSSNYNQSAKWGGNMVTIMSQSCFLNHISIVS